MPLQQRYSRPFVTQGDHTAEMEYLPPCYNMIIKGCMQLVLCRTKMNMMTELLRRDNPPLPRGAHIRPVFTEYNIGSQQVSVELYNMKDIPIQIPKGTSIAHICSGQYYTETIMIDSPEAEERNVMTVQESWT